MKYAILLFSTSLFFSSFTYAQERMNSGTEGSRNKAFDSKVEDYKNKKQQTQTQTAKNLERLKKDVKRSQIQTQTAKDLERLNTDVKRSQTQTQTAKDLAVLKKNVASNTSKKR